MANNLGVTIGTDATVKTTDVAGVHTPHNNIDAIAAGDNNIGNVDVVTLPALPAGNNNIGDVDVASLPALPAGTNNIGDVDVLSIIPGVTATSLGKAEDAQHADGDVGVMALAVRTDAPANKAADGDYEPAQISDGYTWVAQPKPVKVSSNFTAAANGTTYVAGEWISNNGTAGSVTKSSWAIPRGAGRLLRVRIRKSDQTVATPTIRLYLWDATFTVAVGDNATGAQPLQDCIGFVDVSVTIAGTDDAIGWTNVDIPFAGTTLFGLIQSQSTFTGGTSEVWTIDLLYQPG